MKRVNDPSIFREAGRYMASSKSIATIRQFIIGFFSPIRTYDMLIKVASYLMHSSTFQAVKISQNKVEIIATPVPV